MMFIVMCNCATPINGKKVIIQEIVSMTLGLLVFVLIFAIIWVLSYFAYIDFPDQEFPDLYPAFQVSNSLTGMLFFICIGIGSKKFRAVVLCGKGGRHKEVSSRNLIPDCH